VSEFIPEVIEYIEKIIANGFAYESNGSVYFSVDVFHDDPRHAYSKLVPESRGNAELLADGEGALSVGQSDKRSPSDFALWKKSKEGEPSWDSPWGTGRPGWHIECSVMASKTLEHYGDGCMDIHSGGVDLRFPHHDNEIAQSEAHYNCGQWVNYFLHTGHLHIQGFKMSKSLKNFITIRQALETHSPRQIRILFLLHKYNEGMDYGDNTMSNALVLEKTFIEFFHLVKGTLRSSTPLDSLKYGEEEWTLSAALESAKSAVTGALCDDFDTPSAMKALRELIKATNKYVQAKDEAKQKCVITVVRSAGAYVTKVLRIFGVCSSGAELGFGSAEEGAAGSVEDALAPLLDAFSNFRLEVRSAAKGGEAAAAIMTACDDVRDNVLPELGVRLEDQGETAVWKLDDPEVLRKEREQKEMEILRKKQEKEAAAIAKAEKEASALIPPAEWFRTMKTEDGNNKYSAFDEDGVPTQDDKGEPLTKSSMKSLKKEWERQKKVHEKAIAKGAAS
jgi:cysteinyl-tRNA synthetase